MNNDRKSVLKQRFYNDVEEISKDLIAAYSLRFKQEVPELSQATMRWLDFRFRYVDPMPRPVVLSDRFPKSGLPRATRDALKQFVQRVESGGDLNPYQGKGLSLHNDFSGDKKGRRTDLLWAEWGIHHFHLSTDPLPHDEYFSPRADYLAFCLVGGNVLAVIDVLPHGTTSDFANPELIRTVARNWPDVMSPFELKGMMPTDRTWTQNEIHQLRAAGLIIPISLHNSMYMGPGGGLTSAATSLKVGKACDYLFDCLEVLAEEVADNNGLFRTPEIMALDVEPDFCLAITPAGLCVYESHVDLAFKLPLPEHDKKETVFQTIHNLVLPPWACQNLMKRAGLTSK
ncbi:hypothetical protein [Uliginosibacterium sp. 31-12]|uniref:hypothetical protein n=1 Tax=Uliginosibacterium sp. 31-12 TaxID=3062781 RepID=UPI0026E3B9B6|nr:hypothetical protein [Uliginosibacterium sp. 31-12]MDO6386697.1 hypothetical protein [Uliginosibacterium sp. 31-12]